MGKPYRNEIALLPETYLWGLKQDISQLCDVVRATSAHSLIAIGSGGSLTAAQMLATIHQLYTGQVATVLTPYEVQKGLVVGGPISIWMLTAGGGNVDVRRAFNHVANIEPNRLVVLCASNQSLLAKEAAEYEYVNFFEFCPPSGEDGFLATNSLLALSLLIGRAYAEQYGHVDFPRTFQDLVDIKGGPDSIISSICKQGKLVFDRNVVSVLYGAASKAAAYDLESKFTEAALGVIQMADFRNFAHGRHHWLAKRSKDSSVLAFVEESDAEISRATLRHIPDDIPKLEIRLKHSGVVGAIESIVWGLIIPLCVGEKIGIDPGRPGVPEFGTKIYNLQTRVKDNHSVVAGLADRPRISIERKVGKPIRLVQESGSIGYWRSAYQQYVDLIKGGRFGAIVFDYDGTLVDEKDRFSPPRKAVISHLTRLMDSGILIGIATGRGKSVRRDLQEMMPMKYHEKVLIGYYNGAELGFLGDNAVPDGGDRVCTELEAVLCELERSVELAEFAKVEPRKYQITIGSKAKMPEDWMWEMVQQLVKDAGDENIRVLRSSHSVDILAPSVSKLSVIKSLHGRIGKEFEILTIGDRGRWPGNDFELLHQEYSLSVDEVSANPKCCWNIASPGVKAVQATLEYMGNLKTKDNYAYMDDL